MQLNNNSKQKYEVWAWKNSKLAPANLKGPRPSRQTSLIKIEIGQQVIALVVG
jgi:hypothetical protein